MKIIIFLVAITASVCFAEKRLEINVSGGHSTKKDYSDLDELQESFAKDIVKNVVLKCNWSPVIPVSDLYKYQDGIKHYCEPVNFTYSISDSTSMLKEKRDKRKSIKDDIKQVKGYMSWIDDHPTMENEMKLILKTLIRSRFGE